MSVLYSDRSLPLSKNAANTAFSNNLRLAWDFTGVGALANGAAWLFAGATNPQLVPANQVLTTVNGEPCRVGGSGAIYDYTNTTDYGWQVGAGDFTIAIRINLSAAAAGTRSSEILRISGSAGTALSIVLQEDSSVGWYFQAGGACLPGSTNSAIFYPANSTIILWVRRVGGQTSFLTQNATAQTAPDYRVNAAADATVLDGTWAGRTIINFTSGGVSAGIAAVAQWSVGHSDATLAAIGKDFWGINTNSATADSITVTSPASGATIGSTSTISGTYIGAAPTGIQVQFGANAYVSGTSATIGGGNWSASFALSAGGPSTLRARETNAPSVVSADVTGVAVSANTIAFTTPPTTADGAVPFRLFQRNVSNQASVRITGTYTGAPTSIEYSWNGAAWATLVATPSGGVFDATKTLTGPGQGDLSVRFANATAVAATLSSIGVGDLYLVAGQSNHVGGGALSYVPPTAPSGHAAWVAPILDKTGRWRANVETATDPFSKITNASIYPAASATYAIQATSGSAYGSYFGALATTIMASGIPVAFVPCAMGSTTMADWAVNTATTTLYGALLARAAQVGAHKAVLWWQGEAETTIGTTRSAHEASLNALINDWFTRQGTKWVLMNLNASGNGSGSGGSGTTDTGFNAIHAAIANVAATNTRVAAIGDMNGTTFASIHYASSAEINAAAGIAYTALNSAYGYSTVYATTVSFPVKDLVTGADITGLTNLDYAIFDQARFNALLAPIKKGATLSVNAGMASVDITGLTTLVPGGSALVLAGPSNGLKAVVGQVVVS